MSNPIMTDDHALVSRVKNGDIKAFKMLINQHQRLVAHMVGRLIRDHQDREELCQDVFLKVFEKLREFTFQSRLSTWIATIAYRHAINHMRKQRLEYNAWQNDETWTNKFVELGNPEDLLSDRDMEEWVLKLVDYLPAQYKTVLTLYHLEGMSYEEIGNVTDMPEGTVKSYLFRSRAMIKEKVKMYLGKEEMI